MKTYYNHNGKLSEVSVPALDIFNHSYRYGDGLFETIIMINGKISLADYHFERLFSGMQLLGFNVPKLFTAERMMKEITELSQKNNCTKLARVRLAVSRGNGGANDCDDKLQYTIECFVIDESINKFNENGFVIDIFPDGVKSCDKFSNLKSANYLCYIMAARFARENKLNDALVSNQYGRIAEASIANIFWLKDEVIYTPPLSEGCVAGVMRRHLLEKLPAAGYKILEKPCSIADIENADEIFLTNAVKGIRWVRQFRDKIYSNNLSQKIYKEFIQTIFA
jgi:branched-chain amino acid aminotransferase